MRNYKFERKCYKALSFGTD